MPVQQHARLLTEDQGPEHQIKLPSADAHALYTRVELGGRKHKKTGTHPFSGLAPTIPRQPPNKYLVCLWLVRQLLGLLSTKISQVLSMINCQGAAHGFPLTRRLAKPTGVVCRLPAIATCLQNSYNILASWLLLLLESSELEAWLPAATACAGAGTGTAGGSSACAPAANGGGGNGGANAPSGNCCSGCWASCCCCCWGCCGSAGAAAVDR